MSIDKQNTTGHSSCSAPSSSPGDPRVIGSWRWRRTSRRAEDLSGQGGYYSVSRGLKLSALDSVGLIKV